MIRVGEFRSHHQPGVVRLHERSHGDLAACVPAGFFNDVNDVEASFAGGTFLVAEEDDGVVGMGGLTAQGELIRMRVDAAHRRKGIALELLRCLIAEARQLGFERIFLHTLTEQTAARTLYLKAGFRECGSGEIHGNPVVAYEMDL